MNISVDIKNAKKVIAFAKYFSGKSPVKIIDKNSNKELWTGYMNTSQDIIKEMEDFIYED